MPCWLWRGVTLIASCLLASTAVAQTAVVAGNVQDETGGALPGVSVELRPTAGAPLFAVTDALGRFRFDRVAAGHYQAALTLINFASLQREIDVASSETVRLDTVMHLALNADVTVTGKRTFTNLADAENPAENLLGVAQAASQGAVTAAQIDNRPIMRDGEVLENVPGMIVTQHSGEGKANQYFLRGFNLDHGTDFAQTLAGMPVNMPSNAHGEGYSDLNFMIPELITGIQYSKGPYYADQGDFATAGASNINYANALDKPIVDVETGQEGLARGLVAFSPQVGRGHVLAAFELSHNDGPWVHPDDYKKFNGVLRYSQGDAINGFSLTAMGYSGRWNASNQVPERAITEGLISRFGEIDPTDAGRSWRYSVSGEWQHGTAQSLTKVTAYGIAYQMELFNDFTFFLVDPVHGDQFEQFDHRFVSGARVSHKRVTRWGGHLVENTFGMQARNDEIPTLGLYHTEARVRLSTESQDAVTETNGGVYAQNEIQWTPWLTTMVGLRLDAVRNVVTDRLIAANSGTKSQDLVNPKGGITLGPWGNTEVYANAGSGYHSNDARGTTQVIDAQGNPATPYRPLIRAIGEEVGIRTLPIPHLQSTLSLWALHIDSELVFDGDTGTTEPSLASNRRGVEWANYYAPVRGLEFNADVSWSRARFVDNSSVPEAVNTVVSAGARVDNFHRGFGSLRWRYFGPRLLVADGSVQSKATSLVELEAGYRLGTNVRLALDLFNLFNERGDDVDYYYASRLPGEPAAGVSDIMLHPSLPRMVRVNLRIGL
jgi:hypothetical protein